ncbi:MAG: hypothetical protein K8T20_13940 [Planctomycetes bacterium]|nr:hypothetical protein [Planctomycetota bacterium]
MNSLARLGSLAALLLLSAVLRAEDPPVKGDDDDEGGAVEEEAKAPPKLDKDPDSGLLKNGGFDDASDKGIPKEWSTGPSKRAGAAEVTLRSVETDPSCGKKCGEVTMTGESAVVVQQPVNLGASAGKPLVVTCRIRASQDFKGSVFIFFGEKLELKAEDKASQSTLEFGSSGGIAVEPKTKWQEYTFETELKDVKKGSFGVFITCEKGGKIWLDGWTVEEKK